MHYFVNFLAVFLVCSDDIFSSVIMPPKSPRKANFSSKEIAVLLEEVRNESPTITSQFTTDVTNRKKNDVWEVIAQKLRCCGVDVRTANDAREKYGKLKAEAIQRRDQRRKTGNNPVKTVEWDDLIFDIVGEESPILDGVKVQGLETFVNSQHYKPDVLFDQNDENASGATLPTNPSENATTIYNVVVSGDTVAQVMAGSPSLQPGIPSTSDLNGQLLFIKDEIVVSGKDDADELGEQPLLSSTVNYGPSKSKPQGKPGQITGAARKRKHSGESRLQGKVTPTTSLLGTSLLDNAQQIEKGSLLEQYLQSEIKKNISIVQTNISIVQTNKAKRRKMSYETQKLMRENKRLNSESST